MNRPQSHGVTEINVLTQKIIGHAIEVHRVLGPGLLETIYEAAMCIEFDDAGVKYGRQTRLPAYYKGRLLGDIASIMWWTISSWSRSNRSNV
jgi:PD-(D/E)XK nuclease superfamily